MRRRMVSRLALSCFRALGLTLAFTGDKESFWMSFELAGIECEYMKGLFLLVVRHFIDIRHYRRSLQPAIRRDRRTNHPSRRPVSLDRLANMQRAHLPPGLQSVPCLVPPCSVSDADLNTMDAGRGSTTMVERVIVPTQAQEEHGLVHCHTLGGELP